MCYLFQKYRIMKNSLICLLVFVYSILSVKSNTISGSILDEQQKPLEFCNVLLHQYKDSLFLEGTTSDSTGSFNFKNIKPGNYFIEIIYIGYKTDTLNNIQVTEDKDVALATVMLNPDATVLGNVEIKSTRPVIERKADRLVYNVENSTKSSGENSFDLLRSVPGVSITGNDQINVNGKSGVQVMINGRVENLSGDQLVTFLKSIQSSNIKKIEVISNPSAKFDAEAKGGIINIQLKNNSRSGVNGSVYANYRQNKYASTEAGFNLNVNYKKLVVSMAYNYSYGKGYQDHIFTRDFTFNDSIQQYDEKGKDVNRFMGHFGNLQINYNINDKHTVGISSETFGFSDNHIGNSILKIYDNIAKSNEFSDIQKTTNTTKASGVSPTVNFHYIGNLDTSGTKLEFNYDFAFFRFFTNSSLLTDDYDKQETFISNLYNFTQNNPFIVHLHTSNLNYYKPLKKGHSIETGFKFTWTKTGNDVQFKNWDGTQYILDAGKSNKFEYIENINAIFGIWSKEWKKNWSTNLGLRIEQTNTNQYSVTLNSRTKKHYVDFFPSLFIQKTIKEKHSLNINFSRKIQRPNFEDLNPFEFYLSPYSIWTGNANLKPQLVNLTEITYTFKNTYSFFINHENLNNNSTHLVFQDDSTKISTYRASNFRVRNNLNIGLSINKDLFKWWSISANATYTFFRYNSIVNDEEFKVSSHKGNFSVDNTFRLPKDFQINVFAFYTTPHLDATDIMKSDGMVNISISKSFLKNALKIRLSGNDIFRTKNFSYTTDFFNVHSVSINKFSSAFVGLTVSYNFNKGKQFKNTVISKSNEDEKSRIH